jgi:hypothetical protein
MTDRTEYAKDSQVRGRSRVDHIIFQHGEFRRLWAYLDRDGKLKAVIDAPDEADAMVIASGWDPNGARQRGFRIVPATVEWTEDAAP